MHVALLEYNLDENGCQHVLNCGFLILGYRWAKPLGMENHEITDQQLTVSSTHSNRWLKDKARLNHPDAWLSIHWADTSRWFQVDFILIATILEIWTQGHQRYVTKTYHVYYGYETAALQPYKQGGVTKVMIPQKSLIDLSYNDVKREFVMLHEV